MLLAWQLKSCKNVAGHSGQRCMLQPPARPALPMHSYRVQQASSKVNTTSDTGSAPPALQPLRSSMRQRNLRSLVSESKEALPSSAAQYSASALFQNGNHMPITVSRAAQQRAQALLEGLDLAALDTAICSHEDIAPPGRRDNSMHAHSQEAAGASCRPVQVPQFKTAKQRPIQVSERSMQRAASFLAHEAGNDAPDLPAVLGQNEDRITTTAAKRQGSPHVSGRTTVLTVNAGANPPVAAQGASAAQTSAPAHTDLEADSLQKALLAGFRAEDMLWEPEIEASSPSAAGQPALRPHQVGMSAPHNDSAAANAQHAHAQVDVSPGSKRSLPPSPQDPHCKRICHPSPVHQHAAGSAGAHPSSTDLAVARAEMRDVPGQGTDQH